VQHGRRATIGAAEPLSYSIVKEFGSPSDARRLFLAIQATRVADCHTYLMLVFGIRSGNLAPAECLDHTSNGS